jgi:hypothetical protein
MRRLLSALAIPTAILITVGAFLLTPSRAEAITLQEIVDLTKAGVSDDVLLALIEVDQRVFSIDPATLNKLKQAGVSDRVMVAIVKSGRTPAMPPPQAFDQAPEPVEPPEPEVVYVDRPIVHEVPVAVPVYVAVGGVVSRRHHDVVHATTTPYPATPFNPFGPIVVPDVSQPAPQKKAPPVYWGWGGKRRPDAWKEQ